MATRLSGFSVHHMKRMHIYCEFDVTQVWTCVAFPKCCLDRIDCNNLFVGTKHEAQVLEVDEMWYNPFGKCLQTYHQQNKT